MANTEKNTADKKQTVTIEQRKKLVITGVTDTDKFNEDSVLLYTCMGEMIVKGKNLHVNSLSTETGEMQIEGDIDAVIYGDSQVRGPLSFLGKVLK